MGRAWRYPYHTPYTPAMMDKRPSNRGGKRSGAGAPPGPRGFGYRSGSATAPVTIARQPDRARAIATLAARGQSSRRIAEQLGIHEDTVQAWRKAPEIQAMVAEERHAMATSHDPKAALTPFLPAILDRFSVALDTPEDSRVGLHAALELAAWLWGRPAVVTENAHWVAPVIHVLRWEDGAPAGPGPTAGPRQVAARVVRPE